MSTRLASGSTESTDVDDVHSEPSDDRRARGTKVVECYDATASSVFASLCRVTVGDRAVAEDLLAETYLQLQQGPHRTVTVADLIALAHRNYLASPPSSRPRVASSLGSDENTPWAQAAWRGVTPDALAALSPPQRVALNLTTVEGFPLTEVARCLRESIEDAQVVLDDARRTMSQAGSDASSRELFRQCEVWFDDDTRDRVRSTLLDKPRRGGGGTTDSDDEPARDRRRRPRIVIGAVVAAVLLFFAVQWLSSSPDDKGGALDFVVPSRTKSASTAASVNSASDQGSSPSVVLSPADGSVLRVPSQPVEGAAGSTVEILAADLSESDLRTVVPDVIVRYTNGNLGMSWTGDCNRPAYSVELVALSSATGLILTTGSFPVVSCTGMPRRWTAVVQPPSPLGNQPVLPVVDGKLVTEYKGYTSLFAPTDPRTVIPLNLAAYGSAVVDQNNQAWVYVDGCRNVDAIRYQSTVGPIFEVHTPIADPVYCTTPSPVQRLLGPRGRQFPQPDEPRPAQPIDCQGPYGSQTDVPTALPYANQYYDGDWTTWDGCLVRSDVIHSQLLTRCDHPGVRVISVGSPIGARVSKSLQATSFILDPEGLVADATPAATRSQPAGAVDTGLRHGAEQLWIVPEDPSSVYLDVEGEFQRLAIAPDAPSCLPTS